MRVDGGPILVLLEATTIPFTGLLDFSSSIARVLPTGHFGYVRNQDLESILNLFSQASQGEGLICVGQHR